MQFGACGTPAGKVPQRGVILRETLDGPNSRLGHTHRRRKRTSGALRTCSRLMLRHWCSCLSKRASQQEQEQELEEQEQEQQQQKGVNLCSKDVTRTHQERPELPTVILT